MIIVRIVFKILFLVIILGPLTSNAICVAGSASSTSSSGGASGSGSGSSSGSGSGSGSGSSSGVDMWEEKVCYNNRPDCAESSSSGSGSGDHFLYFQRSNRNGVWLDERTVSPWTTPTTPACTSNYDIESCDDAWFNNIPTSDNYFTEICGSTCTSVAENPSYDTSSGSITCMVYYVDDISDCQGVGTFTDCSTSTATFCGSPSAEIQWNYNCECYEP